MVSRSQAWGKASRLCISQVHWTPIIIISNTLNYLTLRNQVNCQEKVIIFAFCKLTTSFCPFSWLVYCNFFKCALAFLALKCLKGSPLTCIITQLEDVLILSILALPCQSF